MIYDIMTPKAAARLSRSTSKALARLVASVSRSASVPRWKPDPELVKKFNLIEFL